MRANRLSVRIGVSLFLLTALAALSQAQDSYGMTATVRIAEESAGTSSSSHRVVMKVSFAGGYSDYSTGDYNNGTSGIYDWQFFTTYGGGTIPIHYGGSSSTEMSNGGPVRNGYLLSFPFSYSTTTGTPFKGLLSGQYRYSTWYTDVSGRHVTNGTNYVEITYNAFQIWGIPIGITSIDSRKTYAPPNKDGAYPAIDPNADLRHVSFNGWTFRGGLFAGNAAGVGGDQSGIARIQCQATNPGGLPSCIYTLSMLHVGTPAVFDAASTGWNNTLSLQSLVAGSGSGTTIPIGNLTWDTALDPATCTSTSTIDLSTAANNEYLNFDVGTSFPSRILVKAVNESYPSWRYFGGPTYAPPASFYPDADCKPHLWACEIPTATSSVGQSNWTMSGADWIHYERPTGDGPGGGDPGGGGPGGGDPGGGGGTEEPLGRTIKPSGNKPAPAKSSATKNPVAKVSTKAAPKGKAQSTAKPKVRKAKKGKGGKR